MRRRPFGQRASHPFPLVYVPPIKWTDRTLPVCFFFCIRHCEDDQAAQPCWSQDETVTIHFPPRFVSAPQGEQEENESGGKKSASFIFPAYFIWFFCLPLSLCKTVKGLNNSLCAIHIYIYFFSFGKVKQKNSQAFPRSVEKFNKRIIFSNQPYCFPGGM